MFEKKKLAMLLAELLGTGILTLVILSMRTSAIGYPFFVAIGAGLTLATVTFLTSTASGGHLNPALTLGLWTARKVRTLPAVVNIAMQLAGAGLAYLLYTYLVKNKLQDMAGAFDPRILIAEALGAFVFVWGWVAASSRRLEGVHFAAAAGTAFAVGIIVASVASGAIINPAIAYGTHSWNWATYVLGPVIGAIVAANLHTFLFAERATTAASTTSTKPSLASAPKTTAAKATGKKIAKKKK